MSAARGRTSLLLGNINLLLSQWEFTAGTAGRTPMESLWADIRLVWRFIKADENRQGSTCSALKMLRKSPAIHVVAFNSNITLLLKDTSFPVNVMSPPLFYFLMRAPGVDIKSPKWVRCLLNTLFSHAWKTCAVAAGTNYTGWSEDWSISRGKQQKLKTPACCFWFLLML